jgi:hypothetical protein
MQLTATAEEYMPDNIHCMYSRYLHFYSDTGSGVIHPIQLVQERAAGQRGKTGTCIAGYQSHLLLRSRGADIVFT